MMLTEKRLCPICGSEMTARLIDWSESHVLVIREVPVQECRDFGHQFMNVGVAKEIERLFERDQQGTLKPQEILSTPVVTLNALGQA